MKNPLLLGVLLAGVLGTAGVAEAACDPVEGVTFVCDQSGPEDLVPVPNSPWVLASSYPEGRGGIRVIDTRDLSTTVLAPTASPRERHDRASYPDCPGPIVSVERENFSTHGLALRAGSDDVHTLYATHHGTRESVEVFELNVGGRSPMLTWIGCAVAPHPLNLNSVVALPDGGFAATSFRDMGAPIERVQTGEISGAIWEWHSEGGWDMVPGSESSGPNGIELSADAQWYYIGAWGTQTVARISRGRTPVQREDVSAEFRIDNLRLAPDGSILATGQGSDGNPMTTSNVAKVDPDTWQLEEIIRHQNNDTFGMGTVAIQVGHEIWVGSLRGDRIARFDAPSAR